MKDQRLHLKVFQIFTGMKNSKGRPTFIILITSSFKIFVFSIYFSFCTTV